MVRFRRLYEGTTRKLALSLGIMAPLLIAVFTILASRGDINITGYSGDMKCSGDDSELCYAYINFTMNVDYIYIYPGNWSEGAFMDTDKRIRVAYLEVRDLRTKSGWRRIDLSTNVPGYNYAYRFYKSKGLWEVRIVAYKVDPTDKVKWSIGAADPYWLPGGVEFELDCNKKVTHAWGSVCTDKIANVRNSFIYPDAKYTFIYALVNITGTIPQASATLIRNNARTVMPSKLEVRLGNVEIAKVYTYEKNITTTCEGLPDEKPICHNETRNIYRADFESLENATLSRNGTFILRYRLESGPFDRYSANNALFDPDVTACGTLSVAGTYTLTNNTIFEQVGTCFTLGANDIYFNGAGIMVDGDAIGSDYGIVTSGSRNNLTLVNFRLSGFSKSVYFTTTNNITWDNITADGSTSYSLQMNSGNTARVSNLRVINSSGVGFYQSGTMANVQVENLTLLSAQYGIYMDTGNTSMRNVYISDTTTYSCWRSAAANNVLVENYTCINNANYAGLYIVGAGTNMTFRNVTIIDSAAVGIQVSQNTEVVIEDAYLDGNPATSYDYAQSSSTYSSNVTLINVTYKNGYETVTSTNARLWRYWKYRAYVNDSTGAAVDAANVTIYYNNGTLFNTSLTDSSGFTPTINTLDYLRNSTTRTVFSNYTTEANKTGYVNHTKQVNISVTAGNSHLQYMNITEIVDNPPFYSLNSTNSTLAGTPILHSLRWQDDNGLGGYIFGFCNGTWNGSDCESGYSNTVEGGFVMSGLGTPFDKGDNIVCRSDHTIYMIYFNNTDSMLYFKKYSNGGWGSSIPMIGMTYYFDSKSIDCDGDNVAIVTEVASDGGTFINASSDGGATWGSYRLATHGGAPKVMVRGDVIYTLWLNDTTYINYGQMLFYANSTISAFTTTWTNKSINWSHTDSYEPELQVAGNGSETDRIFVVGESGVALPTITFWNSTKANALSTWTEKNIRYAGETTGYGDDVSISYNTSDNNYIYVGAGSWLAPNAYYLFYNTTNGGVSWSTYQKINVSNGFIQGKLVAMSNGNITYYGVENVSYRAIVNKSFTQNIGWGLYQNFTNSSTYDVTRISVSTRHEGAIDIMWYNTSGTIFWNVVDSTLSPQSDTLWVNDSWVAFSGVSNYSNVTKVVNSTVGVNVSWVIYANDSEDQWNVSQIYYYTTISGAAPQLEADFINPTPLNNTATANTSVMINVSITMSNTTSNLTDFIMSWNSTNLTYMNETLVALFNFENNSQLGECDITGCIIRDLSKWHNDAHMLSQPGLTPPQWTANGKYGGAFQFTQGAGGTNGNSSMILHSDTLNPYNRDFSMMVWFKCIQCPDADISRKGSTATASSWYKMEIGGYGTPNLLSLQFNTNGTDATIEWSTPVCDNIWHHGVAQRRGNQAELWMDGIKRMNTTVTGYISSTANLSIGSKDDLATVDDFMNGTLDEYRLYMNRSFSQEEISFMYYSNLIKYNTTYYEFRYNKTNLTVGAHNYTVHVSDTAGASATTGTRFLDITAGGDTCDTCSWNCAENCTVDTELSCTSVMIANSGYIFVNANVTKTSMNFTGSGCMVILAPGKVIR